MDALRRIEWTARAERDLAGIHEFIQQKWTAREADAFLGQVIDFERHIAQWPNSFRRSERNSTIAWGWSIGIQWRYIVSSVTGS